MKLRSRQIEDAQPKVQEKPEHTAFTIFCKLPIELRQEIWKMTLKPRTVEIQTRHGRYGGFFTKSPQPTALTLCKDSRAAVIHLYPISFFSRFMSTNIRFNFSLDTLYIADMPREPHFAIHHFFDILTDEELNTIQYMAIDRFICWNGHIEHDVERTWKDLKTPLGSLPALKELLVVVNVRLGFDPHTPTDYSYDYCCEFLDELPEEMIAERAIGNALPVTPSLEEEAFPFLKGWKLKNKIQPKTVWGWRRAEYPEYI